MKLLIFILLNTLCLTSFASVVEVVKTGSGTSSCTSNNPRCLFDFQTKGACRAAAIYDAKSLAEYTCSKNGGIVKDGKVIDTKSTKVTAWVDYYVCAASYKVICDPNPARNDLASEDQDRQCKVDLLRISKKYNTGDVVEDMQLLSACKSAIAGSYTSSLETCLEKSLKQDTAAATWYALKYCDLAGKAGRIDDWNATLAMFDGYNFEYIYNNKF